MRIEPEEIAETLEMIGRKLFSDGFNRTRKTLFIWEGVTYYLNAAAVDTTLEWVRSNSAPGGTIIFDYVRASALTARHQRGEIRRMRRYRRLTGEGLVFGIEEGHVEDFLASRGFVHVVDVGAEEPKRLYCTGANQGRAVGDVYSIVHADVGQPSGKGNLP